MSLVVPGMGYTTGLDGVAPGQGPLPKSVPPAGVPPRPRFQEKPQGAPAAPPPTGNRMPPGVIPPLEDFIRMNMPDMPPGASAEYQKSVVDALTAQYYSMYPQKAAESQAELQRKRRMTRPAPQPPSPPAGFADEMIKRIERARTSQAGGGMRKTF